jgi:hypothetical protein
VLALPVRTGTLLAGCLPQVSNSIVQVMVGINLIKDSVATGRWQMENTATARYRPLLSWGGQLIGTVAGPL